MISIGRGGLRLGLGLGDIVGIALDAAEHPEAPQVAETEHPLGRFGPPDLGEQHKAAMGALRAVRKDVAQHGLVFAILQGHAEIGKAVRSLVDLGIAERERCT